MNISKNKKIFNGRILICDHYDTVINEIDIYTETLIQRPDEITDLTSNEFEKSHTSKLMKSDELELQQPLFVSKSAKEYANKLRQRAIKELKKVEQETIQYYDSNRSKIDENIKKYNNSNDFSLENLDLIKADVFANKLGFLISFNKNEIKLNYNYSNKTTISSFPKLDILILILENCYLNENDIDFLRLLF